MTKKQMIENVVKLAEIAYEDGKNTDMIDRKKTAIDQMSAYQLVLWSFDEKDKLGYRFPLYCKQSELEKELSELYSNIFK